ncbi:MAG: hypothetical protein JMDDDDMK_05162 [Acidobacteria bacterium]|nr:hypothetical protein [Acidobacteriota bacterium]
MTSTGSGNSFAALRRFTRERAGARAEQCDFCSAVLAGSHQHLIEPERRRLVCVCDACAVLFSGQGETKYRRVLRRALFLPDFQLTDAQWHNLMIPIQLAFIFHNSPAQRMIALYPSPAGPVESSLELAAWDEIAAANPALKKMEPDVEALLINRVGRAGHISRGGSGEHEYYVAPIDECFRLTGLLRAHWRGLSGGAQVWEEIARFFASLRARAVVNQKESCA